MYKVKKSLLFVLIACAVWYTDAGQFVVKKKKGPSCSMLKEQCYQEIGDIVQCFPQLLKRFAQVQEIDLTYLYQVLTGKNGTFLTHANKEKLRDILKQLCAFKEYVHEVESKMKQHLSFLQSLEGGSPAKS